MIVIHSHVLGQCFSCSIEQCPQRASDLLIVLSTSKKTPSFLSPKLCIWFFKINVRESSFKCIQKTSAIVYGVAANRLPSLLTPLFFGWIIAYSFLFPHGRSDTPPVVTDTAAAVRVSLYGSVAH